MQNFPTFLLYLLGYNYKIGEIVEFANKNNVNSLFISVIYPSETNIDIGTELVKLRNMLSSDIKIILTGRAVWQFRETVDEIGAVFLPDFYAIKNYFSTEF